MTKLMQEHLFGMLLFLFSFSQINSSDNTGCSEQRCQRDLFSQNEMGGDDGGKRIDVEIV